MESKIQIQNKMKDFKIVSKEEFKKFVKEYPKELHKHAVMICEPPLITYHDFSDGKKYPESIIAKFSDEYDKSKIQYKILSN
jgi:hypothetical protein